jgi:hypothetical protein
VVVLRKTKRARLPSALFLMKFGGAGREENAQGFCTVPFTAQTAESVRVIFACEWGPGPI